MSHQPERKEKDCLNCGTEVLGRFCQNCGQENIITHQSFWSLAIHFVSDILHFDGKFFRTIGCLFTRPGFVANQYVQGKRMTYLDPIRMYLFTSAVFFLIFFSLNKIQIDESGPTDRPTAQGGKALTNKDENRITQVPADTVTKKMEGRNKNRTQPAIVISQDRAEEAPPTAGNGNYKSVNEYDSIQSALPPKEKDSWLKRRIKKQTIRINNQYGSGEKAVKTFLEIFLHKLPYLLFLSLPFFALILKVLYSRHKNIYYSDHAVFTLYHYVFSFVLLLLIFGLRALQKWSEWEVFRYLQAFLLLCWPVYLFIEMKNFYQQRKRKTFGKFLLLNIGGFIILLLLFFGFFLFSIFQM